MQPDPEAPPSLPIAGRRLKRLLEAIPEVASIRDVDALAAVACRAARELVGATDAAFALRDEDACRHVGLDAEPAFDEGLTPLPDTLAGRAMLSRESQRIVGRAGSAPVTGLAPGVRMGTLLAVPAVRDEAIAALVVGWRKKRQVSRTAVVLLAALADACAVALENLLLVEQLEQRVEARTAALRRARDDAEAASRAKSAFLAHMSHELRTPLNAVLGFAQILQRDGELSPTQRGRIGSIHRSGEHLLTLITDLLDMARIEAGRLELVEQDFMLVPLLGDLSDMFEIRAAGRGLAFAHRELSRLPVAVRGDSTRLRQVLTNLLSNAVKFTDEGGVTLSSRWLAGRAFFEVRDTGLGIHPEELPAIFEPFTQVGDRHRFSEGTGLGLPITVELIRKMGGSLQVDSEPGEGSSFRFDLPLPDVEAADGGLPDPLTGSVPGVLGYQGRRRRILVVDDRPANRAVVAALLEPLGFGVEEAGDGLEAKEALESGGHDLVLLDLVMPRLDGFGLLGVLRDDPPPRPLPVIAMSASVSELHRTRAVEAGADAFLPKPVVLADLLAVVGRLLDLTWLEAEAEGEEARAANPAGHLRPEEAEALVAAARAGDIAEVEALLGRVGRAGGSRLLDELRGLAHAFELDTLAARVEQEAGAEQ